MIFCFLNFSFDYWSLLHSFWKEGVLHEVWSIPYCINHTCNVMNKSPLKRMISFSCLKVIQVAWFIFEFSFVCIFCFSQMVLAGEPKLQWPCQMRWTCTLSRILGTFMSMCKGTCIATWWAHGCPEESVLFFF